MEAIAGPARDNGFLFVVVGDTKSPDTFFLDGCQFLSVADQRRLDFRFAGECPTGHYSRKNIGYLFAIQHGARLIVETDDDNFPRPAFFGPRERFHTCRHLQGNGWTNIYSYFTNTNTWARGYPLDALSLKPPPYESLTVTAVDCPVQQGLADSNPDVDAIFRLIFPGELNFDSGREVALGRNSWSPFNSQNTTWWPDAFPLMYLPSYCSFRMTDIWRSFVAQRIAWENDWHILFHGATVWQERNDHVLMKDFEGEIPGYLNNRSICDRLGKLTLLAGITSIPDNLRVCYEELIAMDLVGRAELPLLNSWLSDLDNLNYAL